MPISAGQSIGRYHLIEPMGDGGMALVFKARDTLLERYVALKVIRTDLFSGSDMDQMLERFTREAKWLAALAHPNIVKIFDFGSFEGSPYLVEELLPGGTLKTRLGKPLPYRQAAALLAPVARALAYAHGRGIIHRDVKPANILFSETGEPMLTDFGIAKIMTSDQASTLTGTGVGIGTPAYMAPEQSLGQGVDARADIYSLAVVYYELITGRRPFEADTPMAVMFMQIKDPLPRPRLFVPDLPEKVEAVLFKALAKNPNDRYADMNAFASALDDLAEVPQVQSGFYTTDTVMDARPAQRIGASAQPAGRTAQEGPPQTTALPQQNAGGGRAAGSAMQSSASRPAVPLPTPGIGDSHPSRPAVPPPTPAARKGIPIWVWLGVAGVLVVICLVVGLAGGGFWMLSQGPARPTSAPTTAPSPVPPTAESQQPTQTTAEITVSANPTALQSHALNIQTRTSPHDDMVQVFVPAGDFLMGSTADQVAALKADCPTCDFVNETPQHHVYLDDFWIDRTEVTNAQYARCVAANACPPPTLDSKNTAPYYSDPALADYPVIYVTWNDAAAYCKWAGRKLPSEAQWEKAARGTNGAIYPWGDDNPNLNLLNYNQYIGDPTKVGSYPGGASPYGALDMAGNVWEWVNDWYGFDYYSVSPQNNPIGPQSGDKRVMRGGSWFDQDPVMRAANRGYEPFDYSYSNLGLRCASLP